MLGSAIQGAGATRQTLWIDALVVSLVQVPASLFVAFGADLPATRLFQVVAVTYVIYAVVYAFRYRTGSFLETEVHT